MSSGDDLDEAERHVRLRQRHGAVELRLDGNAHAWAWTPNVNDPDERVRIDLLPELAEWCSIGLGRRLVPPSWDDDDGLTVLVDVDLGTIGIARIGTAPISEAAVADLAAAGLIAAIRTGASLSESAAPDDQDNPTGD